MIDAEAHRSDKLECRHLCDFTLGLSKSDGWPSARQLLEAMSSAGAKQGVERTSMWGSAGALGASSIIAAFFDTFNLYLTQLTRLVRRLAARR